MVSMFLKRVISGTVLVVILVSCMVLKTSAIENKTNNQPNNSIKKITTYESYIDLYKNAEIIADEIKIDGGKFQELIDGAKVEITSDGALINDIGKTVYKFDVIKQGLYQISFEYKQVLGTTAAIERSIEIDGNVPFEQLRSVEFARLWKDELIGKSFQLDIAGNDLKPNQIEAQQFIVQKVYDLSGYVTGDMYIYLIPGEHTLGVINNREKMILKSIILGGYGNTPSYEEVKKNYEKNNYKQAEFENQLIQTEYAYQKSDMSIYPQNDKSSAKTSPQDPIKLKLNTIGGSKWSKVGQWISWTIDVPKSGLYKIGMRYRQDLAIGMFVTRELMINGKTPFTEARKLRFNYDSDWQIGYLGDEKENYLFYLEEGQTELTFVVTLGDVSALLGKAEKSLLELNEIYRNILMITGSIPDIYRDYKFETLIPETLVKMKENLKILSDLSKQLYNLSGKKGQFSVILDKLVFQLDIMSNKPNKIAANFNSFQSNIGALGASILAGKAQPLEFDTLFISGNNGKLENANSNLIENVWFGIKGFILSFFEDYNDFGSTVAAGKNEKRITTWIATGRDQLSVIRQLIDNDFIKKNSGVAVNLKLVSAGSLLPSTLAGIGPDVSLSNVSSDPVNFAVRGAVLDISKFSDFPKVIERFHESAMVPYTFMGKTYALPETQSFVMMFYRKDVFSELNLTVPNTWDDYYSLIPEIQKNNMQMGFPVDLAGFMVFFSQTGAPLYLENGKKCNLESNEALESFKKECDLFTQYNFPREYDFINRFRTGQMPIGLADYTLFNTLTIFAPELKGLWEMVPVPGTLQKDGSINRNVISGGLGVMIMKSTKNEKEAWEFAKWWTSADVQSRYALEMESILGPSAKHPSANMESFKNMSWSANDYKNIMQQWENVIGFPEVPGGYMTARNLEFAFTKVFNTKYNPTETLLDYISEIDNELSRKRLEFGID